jgi:hypothetical protein
VHRPAVGQAVWFDSRNGTPMEIPLLSVNGEEISVASAIEIYDNTLYVSIEKRINIKEEHQNFIFFKYLYAINALLNFFEKVRRT